MKTPVIVDTICTINQLISIQDQNEKGTDQSLCENKRQNIKMQVFTLRSLAPCHNLLTSLEHHSSWLSCPPQSQTLQPLALDK